MRPLDVLIGGLAIGAAIGGLVRIGYLWGKERRKPKRPPPHW